MARKNVSLRARLRYEFDRTMAAGPIAMIGWLAFISLLAMLAAAALISGLKIAPAGAPPWSFPEAVWQALMRMLDPGDEGGDVGWRLRAVSLVVTLWGIFVLSSLIGLLTAGVQDRIAQLRKGRSDVLESGHTLILNWSEAVFDIIEQISLSAQDEGGRRVVVVLAPEDKEMMEDALAERRYRRVRLVCRSGDPADLGDLDMVNAAEAASIVVVSPQADDPDPRNIKIALALVQARATATTPCRIVAEYRNSANVEAVAAMGRGGLQAVMVDDLIARIIVNASRQSGLSAVYAELLDYAGMEFHFAPLRPLAGLAFGEALLRFEAACLVGVCFGADIRLNPPMDMPISADAIGIFVAKAAHAIRVAPPIASDASAIHTGARRAPRAERALILGWSRLGPTVATELSMYMAPGSVMTIAADGRAFEASIGRLALANPEVRIEQRTADPTSRSVLRDLDPASCDHVIVLACRDDYPIDVADTRTLVTLMHLRQAMPEESKATLVSEILDVRNRTIAHSLRADDFVVSKRLVSLLLTQMAENERLLPIFMEILDENGSEIYVEPVEDYVALDAPVSFATVVAAAARRGECAFGYKASPTAGGAGDVVLNPAKRATFVPRRGDCVIVIARGRNAAGP